MKFYRYVLTLPDGHILPGWQSAKDFHWHYVIQRSRGGDPVPVLYRLYGLTGDGQPAALQPSPAYTTAATERLRFEPLGCQRCRLSVLPQATDDREIGVRWKTPPAKTLRRNR